MSHLNVQVFLEPQRVIQPLHIEFHPVDYFRRITNRRVAGANKCSVPPLSLLAQMGVRL